MTAARCPMLRVSPGPAADPAPGSAGCIFRVASDSESFKLVVTESDSDGGRRAGQPDSDITVPWARLPECAPAKWRRRRVPARSPSESAGRDSESPGPEAPAPARARHSSSLTPRYAEALRLPSPKIFVPAAGWPTSADAPPAPRKPELARGRDGRRAAQPFDSVEAVTDGQVQVSRTGAVQTRASSCSGGPDDRAAGIRLVP